MLLKVLLFKMYLQKKGCKGKDDKKFKKSPIDLNFFKKIEI